MALALASGWAGEASMLDGQHQSKEPMTANGFAFADAGNRRPPDRRNWMLKTTLSCELIAIAVRVRCVFETAFSLAPEWSTDQTPIDRAFSG